MSALLDGIIADRKAKAIEYEEYLKRIAELAKNVQAGRSHDTPAQLDTPGRRALYSNLRHLISAQPATSAASPPPDSSGDDVLELALKVDDAVKRVRPAAWRGVQAREQVIKHALYGILQDVDQVERIFLVIKAQGEY